MLGIINFTHSDPLYRAFETPSLVVRDTPKKLLEMLLNGKIDCGMVSLLEYFGHMEALELVESATIHSKNATMSTLLISRTHEIKEPMKIAVTEHTKTTAFYLELILKKLGLSYELKWSKEREADALLREEDYALVIGDEALKVFGTQHVIIWDIGSQFSSLYSSMPVFSVTVKRKGSDCSKEIQQLDNAIAGSKKFHEECADEDSKKLNLDISILRQYFQTIRYDFDSEVLRTLRFVQSIVR